MGINNEAVIVINGQELSSAESMTVRVALENFASDLKHDGLGDDEHGKVMVQLYMKRIDEVRNKLYRTIYTPTIHNSNEANQT